MKKIFPYISVLAGFLVIGLYMYSTVSHNNYIKEQEKKIVKEQNAAREISEENKILWKTDSGELLYKTVLNDNYELVVTDLNTNLVQNLSQIKAGNKLQFSNDISFVFWLVDDDHANILVDEKIVHRLTAVY